MAYKEIFWMACDSTEQLRAEYGPFHTRDEAEVEAQKLGFSYLLRYEHLLDENEEIQEVRCIFLELPGASCRHPFDDQPAHSLRHLWSLRNSRQELESRSVGGYSRVRTLSSPGAAL